MSFRGTDDEKDFEPFAACVLSGVGTRDGIIVVVVLECCWWCCCRSLSGMLDCTSSTSMVVVVVVAVPSLELVMEA